MTPCPTCPANAYILLRESLAGLRDFGAMHLREGERSAYCVAALRADGRVLRHAWVIGRHIRTRDREGRRR